MSEQSSVTGDRAADFAEIDTTHAHVARVYDYLLGGTTNFAVDRAAAEQATAATGGIENSRIRIRANRRFLGRAVRYLAGEVGIRQFLDIGTGIPNEDNVHGVAQHTAPDAKIVYVDNDPVVLAHAHTLLASSEEGATVYIPADLREPETILREARATLDFSQPVAVLFISMMHLFSDPDDPWSLVERFVDAVPSGSYLVMSHLTSESEDISKVARAVDDNATMRYRLVPRGASEIARFFEGLEMVAPGLVRINQWRPDDVERAATGDTEVPFYGAVGRKA